MKTFNTYSIGIILLLAVTSGCNDNKSMKQDTETIFIDHYPNGNVMEKMTTTEYTSYYPDGRLESKSEVKDSVRDGTYERYAHNGSLYAKGKITKNLLNGKTEYFDTITGNLEKVVGHVIINHKDSLTAKENEAIYIDKNGDIIEEISIYYLLYYDTDTLKIGNDFNFHIEIHQPYYKTCRLIACELDEFFKPVNIENCGSKIMKNHEISLAKETDRLGTYTIRGIVECTDLRSEHLGNEELPPRLYIYVEKEIFVIP